MGYGEEFPLKSEIVPVKDSLMKYLPYYYQDNEIQLQLQTTILNEINMLYTMVYNLLDQLFVETADWGLEIWEKMLGLSVNPSSEEAARRTSIILKLRGLQVTKPDVIKSIAEGFSGGKCVVLEYPHEYRFDIKFNSPRGIPPRLAELVRTIEELKPAHLVAGYIFNYATWFEAATYLWDEAKKYTWEEFRSLEPKFFWNPDDGAIWLQIYLAKDRFTWDALKAITWDKLHVLKPEI